ncbi:transposase [Bacillus cereus]|nr:transposase [Bacillus cereus]
MKSSRFQSIRHTSRTLKRIKTVHSIYKQNRSHIPNFSVSTYKELQKLFRTAQTITIFCKRVCFF